MIPHQDRRPMTDYPDWICADCGMRWGRKPDGNRHATLHAGTCGICGNRDVVTEPRDYGHLRDGWQRTRREDQAKGRRDLHEG